MKCEVRELVQVVDRSMLEKLSVLNKSLEDLMFNRELYDACNAAGDVRVVNPAVVFTKKAKAGEFDVLSDDEYERALDDVEKLSVLFHSEDCIDLQFAANYYDLRDKVMILQKSLSQFLQIGNLLNDIRDLHQAQDKVIEDRVDELVFNDLDDVFPDAES